MRYLLLFLFIVAAFWLGITAVQHSSDITISYQWDNNPMSVSLTSTTLLIAGILGLIGLYIVFSVLKFIFGFSARLKKRRHNKLANKAKEELTKGLVQFTEGHWKESESLLLNNVAHSENPLLNYLAASQAEMQFSSNQTEQARATLIRLLEVSPKHPYALKLLAKVYYQQEDWNNLFALLPDLNNSSILKDKDAKKYQQTALTGIFQSLARKKDIKSLHSLWKKLPKDLQQQSSTLLLYCETLSEAGDDDQSNKLIINRINKNPDEALFERYGLIEHENLGNAIKNAEEWLLEHNKSPMLLLALARLNRKYKLWGKSKSYYNASLNFSPSSAVYLELAELLEQLSEHENAELCYKQGLEYSIYNKGEILNLKPMRPVESTTRPRLQG